MNIDNRTPAEIAYDNLKPGAAWQIELAREADRLIADEALTADEETVLDLILARQNEDAVAAWIDAENTDGIISILEEIDGGEPPWINERFDRVIDRLAQLPDALQARALDMIEGFLCAVAVG